MKIHRSRPQERFTIIPDDTLRDPRLSYAARGVLAEILSRPDDWDTNADAMWRRARSERGKAGEGRDVLRAVFAELEACGYLQRVVTRSGRGRIATDVHLSDVSAGRTDDGTGRRRSYQGKHAVSAGRTDDGLSGVGQPGAGANRENTMFPQVAPTTGRVGVYTETENEDQQPRAREPSAPPPPLSADAWAARERLLPVDASVTGHEAEMALRILAERGAHSPIAVLGARIRDGRGPQLIQETRQRLNGNGNGHQPRKRRARAPCGRCDANRQIELGDGTVMRCPDCHPLAAGVAS